MIVQGYAKTLYGLPADEWCKKMYQYLEAKRINIYTNFKIENDDEDINS